MGAAKAEKDKGAAAQVAARRRAPRGSAEAKTARSPKGGKSGKSARGGKGSRGSGILRALKLLVLVLCFGCIGFFAVLVLDVGSSLLGKVRLGETTVDEVWAKVVDRFLDNDVPRAPDAPPKATPSRRLPRPPSSGPRTITAERAPIEAARPEADARHVTERPDRIRDPEVEAARKRLDDLLGRL